MIHETRRVPYAYRPELHAYPDYRPVFVPFHCYWDGELGRKQLFSIKSVLTTQRTYRRKVTLWITPGLSVSADAQDEFAELRRVQRKDFEVRVYRKDVEEKGTPFEGHVFPTRLRSDPADATRLVLLHRYGGCWFDLDCLFLRDIHRLLAVDFVYGWEFEPYANNALIHAVEPGRESIVAAMSRALEIGSCYPSRLYRYGEPFLSEFTVYPCHLFDPMWGVTEDAPLGSWEQLFTASCAIPLDSFFPNSYVFHWHNHWDLEPAPGSYFDTYDREFSRMLGLRKGQTA